MLAPTTTFLSFLLLVGGAVTMPLDTNIAIGLYVSTPIPLIARKVIEHARTEPKLPPMSTEDPVAPTPDEPSAV
jgi:hypothetical protein